MQIRCTYCQIMFPISRDEMLAALQHMDQNKLIFYDAHCPKCRRANRVERKKFEVLLPNWKKTIKEMERIAIAAAEEMANTKQDFQRKEGINVDGKKSKDSRKGLESTQKSKKSQKNQAKSGGKKRKHLQ